MKAAWYENTGPARDVLEVGEMPEPKPAAGEVRIRLESSGVNPGDVKKRSDAFGFGMSYPLVIPHSDGAGTIDTVGEGVPASRVGKRVWCFGAQSYRPFGTAAEFTVVPDHQAVSLPDSTSFDQGACLGIPGVTAHRAVHVGGSVRDRTVLVQGGGGAVGSFAVALAKHAGARVIAAVRSDRDALAAEAAGAHRVVRTDGPPPAEVASVIRALAPGGVDHIVEVAFHANIGIDESLLAPGGSIASYATGDPEPSVPFWPLVFKNARLFFLGSDDFGREEKASAVAHLTEMLESGWESKIAMRLPLDRIADAHESLEKSGFSGRIVVQITA